MARSSSHVIGCRRDQLSMPQMHERCVDGAFRKPGCFSDRAHTGADRAPFVACSLTVKMQINHKRGGLLIMPDQIAH